MSLIENISRCATRTSRGRSSRWIVGVQHDPVSRRLVGENARFGVGVLRDVGVAIEVVGREVQQHRDPRLEGVDAFQLKAARFNHVDCVLGRFVDLSAEGTADVAADEDVMAAGFEHSAGQRRRGRLALGPGDRDDAAAQPARRELELANHGDPGPARGVERRLLRGTRRAEDDQVRVRERRLGMTAELEPDASGA